jgi:hypothetical protein
MKVVTPECVISYPNLFVPTSMEEDSPKKYSCEMIFAAGTDLTKLRNAASQVAKDKWGDKIPKNLRSPFRDGDTDREDKPGYAGCTFMSARSKSQPKVLEGKQLDVVMDPESIYSGCVCIVSVTAFAYDMAGNKGVSFFLNNVWKIRDADRIGGGGGSAESDFAGVEVDADAFGSEVTPF